MADAVEEGDRPLLTASLYGVRSEKTGGGAILVDTRDSTGPLTLIVGAPGTNPEDWSAVQALLERHGIGSVVFAPPAAGWSAHLRRFADRERLGAERRARETAILVFAGALDSLLAAVPVGHGLRASRLVVVAPEAPRSTWWRRLFRRVRPDAPDADTRLATWSGPALVVHAQDDAPARIDAAERLAVATSRQVGVLPGGGMEQAPKHPMDYDWRAIVEFVFGQKQAQDAIVGTDSVVIVIDSSSVTPVPVRTSVPAIRSP